MSFQSVQSFAALVPDDVKKPMGEPERVHQLTRTLTTVETLPVPVGPLQGGSATKVQRASGFRSEAWNAAWPQSGRTEHLLPGRVQDDMNLRHLRIELETVLADQIKVAMDNQYRRLSEESFSTDGSGMRKPSVESFSSQGSEKSQTSDASHENEHQATTLMIKNISRTLTRRGLLRALHKLGFSDSFDYVHLPLDFNTGKNIGFAFINFMDEATAQLFKGCVHSSDSARPRGVSKHWKVAPAKVQGYEANAAVAMSQKKDRIRSRRCKPLVFPKDELEDDATF